MWKVNLVSENALILCAFGIDATQRDQIQSLVRKNAEDWWHQQPDIWIILDDKLQTYWHEHLLTIFHNQAKFFMLKLPSRGDRGYATKGYATWLRENYFKSGDDETPTPSTYAFDEEPF